jgi:hypothetical protein
VETAARAVGGHAHQDQPPPPPFRARRGGPRAGRQPIVHSSTRRSRHGVRHRSQLHPTSTRRISCFPDPSPARTDLAAARCYDGEPDRVDSNCPLAAGLFISGATRFRGIHWQTIHSGQSPAFDSAPRAEVKSLVPACMRPDRVLTPATGRVSSPEITYSRRRPGLAPAAPRRPDRTLTVVKTAWAGLATSCAETFVHWGWSRPLGVHRTGVGGS